MKGLNTMCLEIKIFSYIVLIVIHCKSNDLYTLIDISIYDWR